MSIHQEKIETPARSKRLWDIDIGQMTEEDCRRVLGYLTGYFSYEVLGEVAVETLQAPPYNVKFKKENE